MGVQNLSGQTLGQYELREVLGTGGMGAVYLANQTTLERLVAVKVLNIALMTDSDYLTRFTREARTSASLEHPHIVPVYDYGTQNGISYVVMRYLTGGTLAERLNHSRNTGRALPSLTEVASIIRQLASALDYAHSRGVIHRDVKANNVMFDDKGTAFLVDFGIAKLTHATSALTGTGMTMGTPSYMAPEQWRGAGITPAVDQYALGVLTYAMFTGRMPFEAETPFALMHKHLNEEPTPISVFRADLPDAVRDVLQKVLSKEAEKRYESVIAYAVDLERSVGGISTQPTGFFVTPLPRKLPALPDHPTVLENGEGDSPTGKEITSIPPVLITPSEPSIPVQQRSSNRLPMMIGAALFVLLLIGATAFVALSAQRASEAVNQTATNVVFAALLAAETSAAGVTAQAVAQMAAQGVQTETAIAITLFTHTPTITSTATSTTVPTETPTASMTPSATFTLTPTLDVQAAALATRGAFLTATATRWTVTPTHNLTQTLEAELTMLYDRDLTLTATQWTATYTPTPIPTITPSRTLTATATATSTQTLTHTPSPTPTPTITATIDLREIARATRNAIATQTATQWTRTPTPDLTETLQAELTALADDDLTLTATLWTFTPSPTATFTDTPTLTPSVTASATATATASATASATPTEIRPTATPVEVAQSTPVPTPVDIDDCPGAPPSRLYPGIDGFVLADDTRLVNVRRGAGTGNQVRDQLQISESFTVIEGPVCADEYAWYLVNYGGGGLEGWIAEGDDESYFVAPRGMEGVVSQNYLQPQCALLIEDEFDEGSTINDWFTDTSDRYTVDVFNGSYNLQINFLRDRGAGDPQGESAPALWGSLRGIDFRNASVEAVITSSVFNAGVESRTGLWVRYQADTDFLAFMLRGDGSYRIARFTINGYEDLVGWTRTSAMITGDGATNTLRIDMERDQFDLFINGRFIDTVYDDTWRRGRIAFWGASEQTPATFALDYFRICER